MAVAAFAAHSTCRLRWPATLLFSPMSCLASVFSRIASPLIRATILARNWAVYTRSSQAVFHRPLVCSPMQFPTLPKAPVLDRRGRGCRSIVAQEALVGSAPSGGARTPRLPRLRRQRRGRCVRLRVPARTLLVAPPQRRAHG